MKKIDQAAWDAEWAVASERPADGKKMPVEKDANGNDVYRTYLRDEYQEARLDGRRHRDRAKAVV